MRTLSWTFVFGAIAALAYTSFKPEWGELLGGDVTEEQVRGTLIARESEPAKEEAPRPVPVDCDLESPDRPEACAAPSS
jgi:hypothetical protein